MPPDRSEYWPIIVIGGGASGLMAALSAARRMHRGQAVLILEKQDKIGRKLLATGNGRCNLSNLAAAEEYYHGQEPRFVRGALHRFSVAATLSFFNEIGLLHRQDAAGRIYPSCNQAAAVLDVLRQEAARLSVKIESDHPVLSVEATEPLYIGQKAWRQEGRFRLTVAVGKTLMKKEYLADQVILATGGCAQPALGSQGEGHDLAGLLGHPVIPPFPALVPLCIPARLVKALAGLRFDGQAAILSGQQVLARSAGEFLFTDYGVSGMAAMELARAVHDGLAAGSGLQPGQAAHEAKLFIRLDFLPDLSIEEVEQHLIHRQQLNPHLPLADWLTGLVHSRIGCEIVKMAVELPLDTRISRVSSDPCKQIADHCKQLVLPVSGTRGWQQAQITAGGLDVSAFQPDRLESRLCPGFFATGEVLDIDGDCGGFNLQWAWSSGWLAGYQAAGSQLALEQEK